MGTCWLGSTIYLNRLDLVFGLGRLGLNIGLSWLNTTFDQCDKAWLSSQAYMSRILSQVGPSKSSTLDGLNQPISTFGPKQPKLVCLGLWPQTTQNNLSQPSTLNGQNRPISNFDTKWHGRSILTFIPNLPFHTFAHVIPSWLFPKLTCVNHVPRTTNVDLVFVDTTEVKLISLKV